MKKNESEGRIEGSGFIWTPVVATRLCQRGYPSSISHRTAFIAGIAGWLSIDADPIAQTVIQSWLERVLNMTGCCQTMVSQSKTCGEANKRQVSKIGHPKSQPSKS
jgi:DNA-binding transcriptional regulator YbjK